MAAEDPGTNRSSGKNARRRARARMRRRGKAVCGELSGAGADLHPDAQFTGGRGFGPQALRAGMRQAPSNLEGLREYWQRAAARVKAAPAIPARPYIGRTPRRQIEPGRSFSRARATSISRPLAGRILAAPPAALIRSRTSGGRAARIALEARPVAHELELLARGARIALEPERARLDRLGPLRPDRVVDVAR